MPSKVYINQNTPSVVHRKTGEVSGRKVDRTTMHPFEHFRWTSSDGSKIPAHLALAATQINKARRDHKARLHASAYDSLYRNASGGKRASLGVTLAEWKQSTLMIANAGGALFRSLRALRHGDFFNAIRHLGTRDISRAKAMRRRYDSGARLDRLWLELNFGWAPLVTDIRAAAAVMGQEIPVERIRSRAQAPIDYTYDIKPYGDHISDSAYGYYRLQYVSHVKGVNPNALLAKQLGLTNPLQVAWDLVPFSFVIDWFLPINRFLSGFDASLGVSLGSVAISETFRVEGRQSFKSRYEPHRDYNVASSAQQFERVIVPSLKMPTLSDRVVLPSSSLWQATTSVALVTQQLMAVKANSR